MIKMELVITSHELLIEKYGGLSVDKPASSLKV